MADAALPSEPIDMPRGAIGGELALATLLSCAFGTVMLDRMVQLFLSPQLAAAFRLSGSELGMLAGVVSVAWATSTVLFGVLSDRIGRKRVLIPAMIAFSLASFLSGMAHSFAQLLAVRALLGFCEGPCWSVIMALMTDHSSPRHRGRNLGIVNCAGALVGSAIAPVFATQIAAAFGWRSAFFAAGAPGLIVAALIGLLVAEPQRRETRGTVRGQDLASILRVPGLWLCLAGAACFTTFVISFSIFAPIYLTATAGLSTTASGLVLGASGLGGFFYSLAGPALSDRIGRRSTVLGAAGLSVMLPLAVLSAGLLASPALALVLLLLTSAPAIAALMLIVLPVEYAPAGAAATAIGFVAIGAEGLGATGGPILAGIAAEHWGNAAPLLLCSGAMALVLAVAVLLRDPRSSAIDHAQLESGQPVG